MSDVPNLRDFLSSVPHQLTADLVHLAPQISAIRNVAQTFSWTCTSYNSWLAIAAWWAVCLYFEQGLRFIPPLALAFILTTSTSPPILVTEHRLQATMTDLSTISALLPITPFSHLSPLPSSVVLRVTTWLYIPYLILTYMVPLRIIVGFFGTGVLSWRAPWAIYLRNTVWSSAYFRWSIYNLWARLSGQPLPSPTVSASSLPSQPVNTVRFLFTIYENQRWWMGLDWTHALLPSERPSWCTSRQDPVSPPNDFDLPEPMVVFVSDDKGRRIKRTATWRWEEGEWKVIVRKEDSSGNSRVEKPLPNLGGDNPNLLSKAAVKMKEAGSTGTLSNDLEKSTEDADRHDEDEVLTDPDGWIYGDNKWEGRSGKGGIGKYTRYRRWTRIAVVEEHMETVVDGEIGIQQRPDSNLLTRSETQSSSPPPDTGSHLRQRLRTALMKGPP